MVRIRYSLWLVSGYAHVFVILSAVLSRRFFFVFLLLVSDLDRDRTSTMADAWSSSSSVLNNGCYGRQPLKPNFSEPDDAQPTMKRRLTPTPRWPGVDSLIVAYQRHVHGEYTRWPQTNNLWVMIKIRHSYSATISA